jgi:hypothetical protein
MALAVQAVRVAQVYLQQLVEYRHHHHMPVAVAVEPIMVERPERQEQAGEPLGLLEHREILEQ